MSINSLPCKDEIHTCSIMRIIWSTNEPFLKFQLIRPVFLPNFSLSTEVGLKDGALSPKVVVTFKLQNYYLHFQIAFGVETNSSNGWSNFWIFIPAVEQQGSEIRVNFTLILDRWTISFLAVPNVIEQLSKVKHH